ncbi:hypothetical protein AB0L04_29275, partial [Streptomyces glaucescens]
MESHAFILTLRAPVTPRIGRFPAGPSGSARGPGPGRESAARGGGPGRALDAGSTWEEVDAAEKRVLALGA